MEVVERLADDFVGLVGRRLYLNLYLIEEGMRHAVTREPNVLALEQKDPQ